MNTPPACDICPEPATVVRPATRSRELAFYCALDARMYLGWPDTYHEIASPDRKLSGK